MALIHFDKSQRKQVSTFRIKLTCKFIYLENRECKVNKQVDLTLIFQFRLSLEFISKQKNAVNRIGSH